MLVLEGFNVLNATNQTNSATAFIVLEGVVEARQARAASQRRWRESSRSRCPSRGPRRGGPGAPAAADPRPLPDRRLRIHDRGSRGQGRRGAGQGHRPSSSTRQPRSGPSWRGVFTPFSAQVPQLRFDLDRVKAERLDVSVSDVFTVLQANLGGFYVNDFNLYGKVWKVIVQAEGKLPDQARRHHQPLRAQPQEGQGPLERAGRCQVRPGCDRRAALQHVQRRQDHRPARPGIQLGPGDRRHGAGRRRGASGRLRLRMDRHHVSGAEDRQRGRLHLRACRSCACSCSWRPCTRAGSARS